MREVTLNSFLNRLIWQLLLIMVVAGCLGLAAVWARQEIADTAERTQGVERRLAELERKIEQREADVARATQPENLRSAIQLMGLSLQQPREEQIVRVREDIHLRMARKRYRDLWRNSEGASAATTVSLAGRSSLGESNPPGK